MAKQPNPYFAAHYRSLVLSHQFPIKIQADSVLDVGCDDGYLLSQRVARFKVGIDLRPRISPGPNLAVVQGDGCALPFASGSFEAVLAFDVIEHVADDEAFIASVTRMLAPGGCLWLSTPSDTSSVFPAWLNRRAMKGWGHVRMGYRAEDLVRRFGPEYRVKATLLNAASYRFLYVALHILNLLSPALARIGARLCFELDRRLSKGHDYILLEVIRNGEPQARA